MDARIDENNWIRCGCCGHKLAKILEMGSNDSSLKLEIKCHSCKNINIWHYKNVQEIDPI